jgi:hypothetical protein
MTEQKAQTVLDELVRRFGKPDYPEDNGRAPRKELTLADEEVIALCRGSKNAPKFEALYDHGDVDAYHNGDDSRADASLLGIMAFYTQDPEQLERLFSSSALGQREKWQRRYDYRRLTIEHVLGRLTETDSGPSADDPILVDDDFSSSHSPIYRGSDDEKSEEEKDEPEIVWFHEMGEPKEREYLIEHIGVKGYPVVIYGAGGVAKSFAALAAGIAVASAEAEEWLGLKVLEHGYALYVDFELDKDEQHRRVRDLCAGFGIPHPKRLAYLSGVGLSNVKVFKQAVAFAKKYETKAVVVDSMGLAMAGDMDRGKDVIEFHTRFINPLRRLGATPFIVDHEGKPQAGENRKGRGPIGSVYKGNLGRNVLQFVLEEYDKENAIADIRVRQQKTNFTPLDPWGVRFAFGDKVVKIETYQLPDDELADEKTKPVIDRIRIALAHEDMSIAELEAATGASRGTLYNKITQLLETKEITKRTEGRSSIYSSNVSSSHSPIYRDSDDETSDSGDQEDGELF